VLNYLQCQSARHGVDQLEVGAQITRDWINKAKQQAIQVTQVHPSSHDPHDQHIEQAELAAKKPIKDE